MTLLDLISSRLGANLSPATVFLHPTPRQLAAFAARLDAEPGQASPLVPLSPASNGPSLVLIHAIGGTITDYRPLAAELAGTLGVHGLEAPGLGRARATPASLAELAADYTAMILAANPAGPHYLGGWSMGGVIAHEIARLLEAQGAKVAVLVLLDAPFDVPPDRFGGESDLAGQFVADAAQSLELDLSDAPDPASTTAGGQLDWLAARLGGTSQAALDRQTSAVRPAGASPQAALRARFELFRGHSRMLAGYRPDADADPVRARTLIVEAGDSPNAGAGGCWARLLGDQASVLRVAGDHYSFLRPPVVSQVADKIRALA